jgi:hypothetical protein
LKAICGSQGGFITGDIDKSISDVVAKFVSDGLKAPSTESEQLAEGRQMKFMNNTTNDPELYVENQRLKQDIISLKNENRRLSTLLNEISQSQSVVSKPSAELATLQETKQDESKTKNSEMLAQFVSKFGIMKEQIADMQKSTIFSSKEQGGAFVGESVDESGIRNDRKSSRVVQLN